MTNQSTQAWLTQNPNLAEGEESEKVPDVARFPELPEDYEISSAKKSNWLTDVGGPVFGLMPERVTDDRQIDWDALKDRDMSGSKALFSLTMAEAAGRNLTTEELIALHKTNPALIQHTDGRLKYQPTPEFMDYLKKQLPVPSRLQLFQPQNSTGKVLLTVESKSHSYCMVWIKKRNSFFSTSWPKEKMNLAEVLITLNVRISGTKVLRELPG